MARGASPPPARGAGPEQAPGATAHGGSWTLGGTKGVGGCFPGPGLRFHRPWRPLAANRSVSAGLLRSAAARPKPGLWPLLQGPGPRGPSPAAPEPALRAWLQRHRREGKAPGGVALQVLAAALLHLRVGEGAARAVLAAQGHVPQRDAQLAAAAAPVLDRVRLRGEPVGGARSAAPARPRPARPRLPSPAPRGPASCGPASAGRGPPGSRTTSPRTPAGFLVNRRV